MPDQKIEVLTIGKVACEALAQAMSATVVGKTSRGLFLSLPTGWVIFISLESNPGPLTLNLPGHPQLLSSQQAGAIVYCSPGEIRLPGLRLSLPDSGAKVWQAPTLPSGHLPPDQIRAQLLAIAAQLSQVSSPSPLAPMLPLLFNHQEHLTLPDTPFGARLVSVQAACKTGRVLPIAASLSAFLGLGPGLTPSGDDLVAGFLLAANRWGPRIAPAFELAPLNQHTLAAAQKATTTLSSSLIACAALGQADERLILALDGMVTGTPHPEACFAALSTWGSSSGLDALVGMAIFLLL